MSKIRWAAMAALMALGLMVAPPQGTAASKTFTARVTPLEGRPLVIEGFSQNKNTYWRAKLGSSFVNLEFAKIARVRFLTPGDNKGSNYSVEITFRDGVTESFILIPYGNMYGRSRFGPWDLRHNQVKLIEFIYPGGASPSGGTPRPVGNVDQITLKNGDQLGGVVQNPSFTLRTSYGVLSFGREKIRVIEFEGGGQNVDVVILRTGDKISGVIQDAAVKVILRAGGEAVLSRDKLKRLQFKE